MADWNPSLYLQFASERTRPAAELLARVAKPSAKHIADLGCGPGNSTELLRGAWPDAVITGVDNSPAMLDKAQKALPDCQFVNADIGAWQPEQPLDVLYANASLQWVSGHCLTAGERRCISGANAGQLAGTVPCFNASGRR
jgi:trans-aconitate 2-methyltransferase